MAAAGCQEPCLAAQPPEQALQRAEEALLLSNYAAAEQWARQACSSPEQCERALIVAVQALYETKRLGAARRLLQDCHERLEDAPPNVVLLWLAIAVDSQYSAEAQRTIQSLLDTRQPSSGGDSSDGSSGDSGGDSSGSGSGPGCAWSRRQYLALLHLYAFEVLLRQMREPAEVMRWVRETQLPLAPEERQLLLDELEGHQRQQAALGGGGPAGRPAADSAWGQEGAADEERPFAEEDSPAAGPPPPRPHVHQTKARTAGTAGVRRRLAAGDPEILPAEEEEGAGPAPGATLQSPLAAGVEWLGWCGQQAQQAAAAVLRPLVSGLGAEQPRRGAAGQQAPLADPAAALHLLGGGVLGAVLLYAVYAERQALGRGARRARQAVVGSVAELLRMAFSLGVNPMA